MKNYKRAYRRYKKQVHFKRRAKNYFHSTGNALSIYLDGDDVHSWGEFWPRVKAGEKYFWMRHTGKVCSCYMCSPKYERPTPEMVRNIINEQLKDHEDLNREFETGPAEND